MQSSTMKLRAVLTIAALAVAPLAISAFTPTTAVCQDDEVDEIECEFEGMSIQTRDDGSTWMCFDSLECGDVVKGEDVCYKMA